MICRILELSEAGVHLVILGLREAVFDLVGDFLVALGRGEREAGLALEERLPGPGDVDLLVLLVFGDELAEDAAQRPHLDALVVLGLHEDDLGGAVPAADHVGGHQLPLAGLHLGEGGLLEAGAGESEVAELDVVVVVGEDVFGLEVAVQDLDGGEVLEDDEELVHDLDDLLVVEELVFAAELAQVEGQVLQHHVQLVVVVEVGGRQDVEDLDDLGVLHASQDRQLPQRPQRQHPVLEDVGVLLYRVDLARLAVLHAVHLPVRTVTHDVYVQEALVVHLLRRHLQRLQRSRCALRLGLHLQYIYRSLASTG